MADILRFPTRPVAARNRPGPAAPLLPADADARAAALDTFSSCIVEAPAGSGKTGLIVQRFLKLLAGGDLGQASDSSDAAQSGPTQPEEVLAMTFTRKATAEMQQRVFEQLQSAQERTPLRDESNSFERETRALAEAVLARSAQLGWNLLAQPQRLNIRSMLSLCLEIANSLPLLSGSGAQREPIEDARPLYRLAARRTLLQLGGSDRALHDALRTTLLHRDGNLADCESLIADMLATRDQWGELVPLGADALDDATLDQQVRPKLERALENIVCAGLSRVLKAMPPHALQDLTTLAARLGVEPGYNGNPSPLALCAHKHEPPDAIAAHLDHWLALVGLLFTKDGHWRSSFNSNHVGLAIPKSDKALLKRLVDEIQTEPLRDALCAVLGLPPAKYPDDQWEVARSLFHVLRRALVELKLLFSDRGECDYVELALAAREALLSGDTAADVALSAGGRLRHLLVDEMQDTSAAQYELIKLLTSSWDGHSQTLFLVGDPKQSIYLFRQARVERFLRTMREQRLGEITLVPLRLTANFRSQAALVQGFNDIFGGSHATGCIFPPPGDEILQRSGSVDVPFVAATPIRPQTAPDAIVWHTSVMGEEHYDPSLNPTCTCAADHSANEAVQIRRIIEQRLALPLPEGRNDPLQPKPWRIAVLARARNHLSAVVQELKAHDGKSAIPFRAVDLDPLDELPEVLDALALTRALLHPADRIAWLAVLHAPWCGLGLADLLALTGEGQPGSPDGKSFRDSGSGPELNPVTNVYTSIATLVSTRHHHLSPLGQRLLDRAWPVLETAVATRGCNPLSVHVERTWRSLGGDAPLAAEQRSNVLRFLGVLRDVERDSGLAGLDLLSVLMARLKELYAEPGDAVPSGQGQSVNSHVELMTIHKAKGLEWDLVLIPGLDRRPRGSQSLLLNWLELDGASGSGEEAFIILAPIWGKGEASDKLNNWLKDIRARRERAEEKRLFYVAATRAREQLHLFAAASRGSNLNLLLPANGSLLKACWPAAEPHFAALAVSTAPPAPVSSVDPTSTAYTPPIIQRLPLSFDPGERFTRATGQRLPYIPATALRYAPAFDRPEGSLAARAFGNVVHRYLQAIAARLAAVPTPSTPDALLAELPSWEPRLNASLRGEGLPPGTAAREATRALRALQLTLSDPTGRWILAPHTLAASERTLTMASLQSLRVDRTFVAGAAPLSPEADCIWIIDFKTTEQGSYPGDSFAASEIAKYKAQLEAYAAIRRSFPDGHRPIHLGLFYPLIPRLLYWQSTSLSSEFITANSDHLQRRSLS